MRLTRDGCGTDESVAGKGIGALMTGRRCEGIDNSSESATRGPSAGICSDFPVDSCLEIGSAEENEGFSDMVEGVARESVEDESGGTRGLPASEDAAELDLLEVSSAETYEDPSS